MEPSHLFTVGIDAWIFLGVINMRFCVKCSEPVEVSVVNFTTGGIAGLRSEQGGSLGDLYVQLSWFDSIRICNRSYKALESLNSSGIHFPKTHRVEHVNKS